MNARTKRNVNENFRGSASKRDPVRRMRKENKIHIFFPLENYDKKIHEILSLGLLTFFFFIAGQGESEKLSCQTF
jgi:hypothetical protein